MSQAIVAVENGMSYRKASTKYQISKSTICKRLKNPGMKLGKGGSPILTDDEEQQIVTWIIGSAKRGGPLCSLDVMGGANRILHRRTGSEDKDLGWGWLGKFKNRHNLVFRSPENLSKASANLTKPNIEGWFASVSAYILNKPGLIEAMSDRSRVMNADKTMVRLNASSDKVLAPKGMKNVFEVTKDDKAGITTMGTFRADGVACKPFIIYPYNRIPSNLSSNFPHDRATLAATASGWMDTTTFCRYLRSLAQQASESRTEFPLILFVDNHSSHTALESCETAKELNIIMVFLYPNSTFLLQPADVADFRSLKSLWKKENRVAKMKEITITKLSFAQLFLRAFDKISPLVVTNGFYRCGLFPFDSSNVDYTKCIGKESSTSSESTTLSRILSLQPSSSQTQNLQMIEAAAQNPMVVINSSPYQDLSTEVTLEMAVDEMEFGDALYADERDFDEYVNEEQEVETNRPFTHDCPDGLFSLSDDDETNRPASPILKLPPTPKRKGKRNVKKTHPVAEENIDNMRESRNVKLEMEHAKQERKTARIKKQEESKAAKLAKVLKRMEKDKNTVKLLTQSKKI